MGDEMSERERLAMRRAKRAQELARGAVAEAEALERENAELRQRWHTAETVAANLSARLREARTARFVEVLEMLRETYKNLGPEGMRKQLEASNIARPLAVAMCNHWAATEPPTPENVSRGSEETEE